MGRGLWEKIFLKVSNRYFVVIKLENKWNIFKKGDLNVRSNYFNG